MTDEYFMLQALKEAKKAFDDGEVPVGAIVTLKEKIISRGHNQVERLQDPTAHAEIVALREAAGKPGATPAPTGSPVCGMRPGGSGNEITAGAVPMNELARLLNVVAARTVVDRTGLNGVWDFDLQWSPPNAPNADPDRPSIFTALPEQLGLRLDATTGPVEVLVIDRVERPIPD